MAEVIDDSSGRYVVYLIQFITLPTPDRIGSKYRIGPHNYDLLSILIGSL
jgi:hypothetical protein